ncbi:MAG: tRNA dimethylallyltransferase [Candidatus Paceibacteria bacterium]|jgi:tRNA dimethylallyltransferase
MNLFSLFKTKPKVIVICGPTATGKTSLSIAIAKQYNGEVISADSRQVYRGLDVGSAKVMQEEMQCVPHHMIDITDPKERYAVAEFVYAAKKKIVGIVNRKGLPIICGGTGQYIDALVFNQSFPEVSPNQELRNKLEKLNAEELFARLLKKDPIRAKSIDQYNKVRLVRALEIIDALGVVPKQKQNSPYKALFIGLDLDKELLNKRIEKRIIDRLENEGMLDEAKNLHEAGLSFQRLEELGLEYRFMARHLQDQISYDDMIEQLSIATRQFAKRQRTWFKRNKKICWFNPSTDQEEIMVLVKKFLKK